MPQSGARRDNPKAIQLHCDDDNDAICICFRCRETIVVPPPPFDDDDNFDENDDIPLFTTIMIYEPELHLFHGGDVFYRVTNPYEQIWFED